MKIKRNASILFVLLLISKILGSIREAVLFANYESGSVATAYFVSNRIPNVIFGIATVGLISTFIPIYSKIVSKEGKDRAKQFMDNIMTIIFFMTLGLLILGLLFTEQLVTLNLYGDKITPEVIQLTVDFTRVTLFALLANGVFSIYSGFHQYEERFYVTPITGFFLNIIIITSIIVSTKISKPILMAYGVAFAAFVQLIVAALVAKYKGNYDYRPSVNFKDEYLKPMILMSLPIMFGSSVNQINTTIDSSIASQFGAEAVATIGYSSKVSLAIYTLFVGSITTVMYPSIITQASNKEYDKMKSTIVEVINIICLIVIPATVGAIILSKPIIQVFYGHASSTDPAVLSQIQFAFIGGIIGLIGMSIKDVLVRVSYSLHDSMLPVISSVLEVMLNIFLNVVLSRWIGVPGLTLATSISSIVGMLILYLMINKKLQGLKIRKLIRSMSKITISSLIMGVVVYFAHHFINGINLHYLLNMGLSALLGMLVFAVCIYILKVEEFMDGVDLIKDKFSKKKAK